MSTGGVGHEHRFDPISGWCGFCNLREDGRLVTRSGEVIHGGREYTTEQLEQFRERASAR